MKKIFYLLAILLVSIYSNIASQAAAEAESTTNDYYYEAEWKSQDQGNWGSWNAHMLFPGEEKDITAKFYNVGENTWYRSEEKRDPQSGCMVGFYVYKDVQWSTPAKYNDFENFPGLFGSTLWNGPNWGPSFDGNTENARAAIVSEESVKPGEIGTFKFTLYAPHETDYANDYLDNKQTKIDETFHREDLTLAYCDQWMPNYTNGDPDNKAHVWFPIRFEDGFLTQEEIDDYDALVEEMLTETTEMMNNFSNYDNPEGSIDDYQNKIEDIVNSIDHFIINIEKIEPPYELRNYHQINLDFVYEIRELLNFLYRKVSAFKNGIITQEEFENLASDEKYLEIIDNMETLENEEDKIISELEENFPKLDFSTL